MSKPRIGLDLDGVVYAWEKTARYMLRTMRGYEQSPALEVESQSWDHIQENVLPEDWQWLWSEGVERGLFRHGHLYPGAIEGVRALAKLGDVVVITSRPKNAVNDTLAFLAYQQLPLSGIHVLSNGEKKSEVSPMCDVYIDDAEHNAWDILSNTLANLVLFDRPWNRSYLPGPRVLRAKTWADVVTCTRYALGVQVSTIDFTG